MILLQNVLGIIQTVKGLRVNMNGKPRLPFNHFEVRLKGNDIITHKPPSEVLKTGQNQSCTFDYQQNLKLEIYDVTLVGVNEPDKNDKIMDNGQVTQIDRKRERERERER